MARMRFGSHPRPKTIGDAITVGVDRLPEHLGDIPALPSEPPAVKWSLTTWPATEPVQGEEATGDG